MLAGTLTDRELNAAMREYEGLVHKTALMLVTGEHRELRKRPPIEESLEDVEQLIRIKVFKALQRFDPTKKKKAGRGRSPRDAYVFMCVSDVVKDIVKKKRRGELLIDDIAPAHRGGGAENGNGAGPRDKFDQRYLSQSAEQTFADVEDEMPELPSTLSDRERNVVALLYLDYRQTEIATLLGVTKREVESAVRGIRTKMADWRPTQPQEQAVAA